MNDVQIKVLEVLSNPNEENYDERLSALDSLLWNEVPGSDYRFFRNCTDVASRVDAQAWIDYFLKDGGFCHQGIKAVVEDIGFELNVTQFAVPVTMTLTMMVTPGGGDHPINDRSNSLFRQSLRSQLHDKGVQCDAGSPDCDGPDANWAISDVSIIEFKVGA